MRLKLNLTGREVAMVSETDGVFVVEPMRFLWPSEAKREAYKPRDQIAWCPEAYKPLYRSLRKKQIPARIARPLVEKAIDDESRRSLNVLSCSSLSLRHENGR